MSRPLTRSFPSLGCTRILGGTLLVLTPWILACTGNGHRTSDDASTKSKLRFQDVTETVNLGAIHHVRGTTDRKLFPKVMGAGVAFTDLTGDRLPDLLVVGGGAVPGAEPPTDHPSLQFYRNAGDGTFEQRTEEVGLDTVRAYGYGLSVADYDNDGDADFLLTTLRSLRLFENRNGRFQDVTRKAGLSGYHSFWTSAAFFDSNKDGLLDLYVGGYVDWSPETNKACAVGDRSTGYCTPLQYEGVPGRFFRNTGDGRFVERSRQAGFLPAPGKTLGVVTLDANKDGWPDLFVANDTNRDLLYVNQGDGTFVERGRLSGVAFSESGLPRGGMGTDAGTLDSTGRISIVVGNFSNEMTGVYRRSRRALFDKRDAVSRVGRPTLPVSTFGLFLFDADLDRDLDLFAANGHLQPLVEKAQDGISYRQPPQLFLNRDQGRFIRADTSVGEFLGHPLLGRGAAFADYDRDGDLDVVVTENDGPLHLYRNELRGPRSIRVDLVGDPSNRDAIGAVVVAHVAGEQLVRRQRSGRSYLSQPERVLTFGLGGAVRADSLTVYWPSGTVHRFGSVEAGETVYIQERTGGMSTQPPQEQSVGASR